MKICDLRIDERLIHGQVATFWISSLGATRVIVVDDKAANDDLLKSVLKMACPSGIKLSVLDATKAAKNLIEQKYDQEKIFIVCKSPKPIVQMMQNGFKVSSVTVGNMSGSSEKKKLNQHISVTAEDIENFQWLYKNGVHLFTQLVPQDSRNEFMPLLDK